MERKQGRQIMAAAIAIIALRESSLASGQNRDRDCYNRFDRHISAIHSIRKELESSEPEVADALNTIHFEIRIQGIAFFTYPMSLSDEIIRQSAGIETHCKNLIELAKMAD